MKNLDFLVTLWPTFPHFKRFAFDPRVNAIRLNSAMSKDETMEKDLKVNQDYVGHCPLYFDVKGRQLRIKEVYDNKDHLEFKLTRPIKVDTPTTVLFKAGEDYALLKEIKNGNHLIFEGGPKYLVYPGESIHIRDPNLEVGGKLFLDYEVERIAKARKYGFDRFFLSYVESQKDIDEFREYVGDSEIFAKIENLKGLKYVANEFVKKDNLYLLAARGDLYVEVERPHHIVEATKLIINKDPEAGVGSRLLLSLVNNPVPSCSDLSELAWLYDIGYRKMMLCDELCLKNELLGRAVNVFDSFKEDYVKNGEYKPIYKKWKSLWNNLKTKTT